MRTRRRFGRLRLFGLLLILVAAAAWYGWEQFLDAWAVDEKRVHSARRASSGCLHRVEANAGGDTAVCTSNLDTALDAIFFADDKAATARRMHMFERRSIELQLALSRSESTAEVGSAALQLLEAGLARRPGMQGSTCDTLSRTGAIVALYTTDPESLTPCPSQALRATAIAGETKALRMRVQARRASADTLSEQSRAAWMCLLGDPLAGQRLLSGLGLNVMTAHVERACGVPEQQISDPGPPPQGVAKLVPELLGADSLVAFARNLPVPSSELALNVPDLRSPQGIHGWLSAAPQPEQTLEAAQRLEQLDSAGELRIRHVTQRLRLNAALTWVRRGHQPHALDALAPLRTRCEAETCIAAAILLAECGDELAALDLLNAALAGAAVTAGPKADALLALAELNRGLLLAGQQRFEAAHNAAKRGYQHARGSEDKELIQDTAWAYAAVAVLAGYREQAYAEISFPKSVGPWLEAIAFSSDERARLRTLRSLPSDLRHRCWSCGAMAATMYVVSRVADGTRDPYLWIARMFSESANRATVQYCHAQAQVARWRGDTEQVALWTRRVRALAAVADNPVAEQVRILAGL